MCLHEKSNEFGEVIQNKPRLVAQGYSEQEGVGNDEIFAPVERLDSICLLLAFAASKGFMLVQIDVKSVFLNGFIKEEVFLKKPTGFENSKFPYHIFKHSKALYGLKQAPRVWYDRMKILL